MKLREQILLEHSKANCAKVAQWVGSSQERFDELFQLFLKDEYRVTQRAAWPMSYCVEAHPYFIEQHFDSLIKKLQAPQLHNAIKRNTVRFLQHVAIPEAYQGAVMDICFTYVASPTEAVAVKAFSLTVLANLAKQYPEIIPEIRILVEEQLPHQTAAFRSRAKAFMEMEN